MRPCHLCDRGDACQCPRCYLCLRLEHFPALCSEADMFFRADKDVSVRSQFDAPFCNIMWTHHDMLLDMTKRFEFNFNQDMDAPYEWFEVFYNHPHLHNAIVEMQEAIELGRWMRVVFALNPVLEQSMSDSFSRAVEAFSQLYASFPAPWSDRREWDLSTQRRELGVAVSQVLLLLHVYRRRVGVAVSPPVRGEDYGSGGAGCVVGEGHVTRGGGTLTGGGIGSGFAGGGHVTRGGGTLTGGGGGGIGSGFAGEGHVTRGGGTLTGGGGGIGSDGYNIAGVGSFSALLPAWLSRCEGFYLALLLIRSASWMNTHLRRRF